MKLPEPFLPNDLPGLVRQLSALWRNLQTLLGTVDSGSYTPTVTGVTNVATVSAQVFQWSRVGNTVTVSGRFDLTATAAAGALTQIGISLPVAANLADGQ